MPIAGVDGTRWCEKCGGVFADIAASKSIFSRLDRTLLEIGFQASLRGRAKQDNGLKVTCPECLLEMVKTRIESANCVLDACPMHGTWFDTGELVDVLRALESVRRRGILSARKSDQASAQSEPEPEPPPSGPWLKDWLRQLRLPSS